MLKYIKYESYIEIRLDSSNKLIGKFVLDIDGFYYFLPVGNGHWSDWTLLQIGNKLKSINHNNNYHIKP